MGVACITVVLDRFFEARGETINEAIEKLMEMVREYLEKEHPEILEKYSRIEVDTICAPG